MWEWRGFLDSWHLREPMLAGQGRVPDATLLVSKFSPEQEILLRLLFTGFLAVFLAALVGRLYVVSRDPNVRWVPFSDSLGKALDEVFPFPSPFLDQLRGPSGDGLIPCGRFLPVTSAASVQRLRRRARWTRALESVLGGRHGVVGRFVRGRWTPDLPTKEPSTAYAYLAGTIRNGVRCLGGGTFKGKEETEPVVYLVLDDGEDVQLCVPELLGRLRLYALFRKRDDVLLGALRTRAVEWCRNRGLSSWASDLMVGPTIGFAMTPSTHEELSTLRVQRAMGGSTLSSAPL